MPRADLLVKLVQSGTNGDKVLFKKVVESIVSEERAKQHHILADKLADSLNFFDSDKKQISFLNGAINKVDNKVDNLLFETTPQVNLNDLILSDNIKNICEEIIEEHSRADLLRSYNLEPRSKFLFVGPPGNGKTSLAEAIAYSLALPFLTVRYEGIIASYLGETSFKLKNLFDYVRTQNCVVFFDEFDSIGKERGDRHETGEIKRVVSSLLLQIDRLPSYVIVVAATNHPELLDKAVWRRFQSKVVIEGPNNLQVEAFLNKFEAKYDISFGYSHSYIAKYLKGLSYSEIQDFCLDILRKYILTFQNSDGKLKSITKQRLDQLAVDYKPIPTSTS
jgi:SpoVK/Ycf46/Vps4 family AAA+-type ATPase